MKYNLNAIVLAAVLSVVTNVNAGTILSPTAAIASDEFSSSFSINNTIDQSGLSSGFVSGVTDFDTYLALNPTHFPDAGFEWFTSQGVTSAQVDYNLGSIYNIDKLALWNEEGAGIGAFDIFTSNDNVTFNLLLAGLMPISNPLNSSYSAQVFSFNSTLAQYVRLNITGCPQADKIFDGCAIGEVAFSVNDGDVNAVPVPAALPLMASALGIFGIARRRNKSKTA